MHIMRRRFDNMPIGNGPDIEQFNRKEEDELKFLDEVQAWWDNLDSSYQLELMEDYYPGTANFMDADTKTSRKRHCKK